MGKWRGAPFSGCLHTTCAQNKTLILNTGSEMAFRYVLLIQIGKQYVKIIEK